MGVDKGGSLEMWARYFPNARVCGVDQGDPPQFSTERIRSVKALQDDAEALARLSSEEAPDGWDIIVDDCSHLGAVTLASFRELFPRLKVGGFYAIEDWGTGYFPHWPDGQAFEPTLHFTATADGKLPSHRAGKVGFIKQVVDEVGMHAIRTTDETLRPSLFEYAHVWRGLVMIRKSLSCVSVDPR